MRAPLASLVVIGMVVAFASTSSAKDITRCGQTIGKGEVGRLMNDLDCPSLPGTCSNDESEACDVGAECPPAEFAVQCITQGVLVEKGARLELNGYTLKSHHPNLSYRTAISTGGMTIVGPGTLTAPGGDAIRFGHGKLVLRNLVIRDSLLGIATGSKNGSIDATDVSILDNERGGIATVRKLTGSNITVSGNGFNTGLPPGSVFGAGISARNVRVDGLTVQNNAGPGVWADSLRIKNSTIDGNNGFQAGVDIAAEKKPRLENTTCGVSARLSKVDVVLGSWDICSGD